MKMVARSSLIFLLAIVGSSVWAASDDDDLRTQPKNSLSEKAGESDDIKPLIDRRSDLDDVDFSSFFDMDTDDDDHDKDDLDKDEEQEPSPSLATNSESSETTKKNSTPSSETPKKNSTPSSQNQIVVGPYQVSVVDSRSPLLSSLGFRGKHLQRLTSSAYSPYSRRRSSHSSRYYSPHSFRSSESVRSSSYAEYPSHHPPNYGHSRPPPPNSYPQEHNKEYVPMGEHYRGNDRELPPERPSPYAEEKVYPPNSVDQSPPPPPPYGSYKPNYAPPPPPRPPPNPVPHNQQSPDAYRGGYYSNQNTDPKYQAPNRGSYGYQEPGQQPYGTGGEAHDTKENSDPNQDRSGWRQSNQHPLHPAPLAHRPPTHPPPPSYSQHKSYPPPSSSPPRAYEKTSYTSSSSYARPADVSQSYSKSQYGAVPVSDQRPSYQSPSASQRYYPSYHTSSGSPKAKTPQRAGTYSSEDSYHHHSPSPSKPMITVKFKTRPPGGSHGHGLSIPINFNPLEMVKKLATPLAALNPLANKKVTIGITIEQKDKHVQSSDILHSY